MVNGPSGRPAAGPAGFARMGSVLPLVLIGIGLLAIAIGANGARSNDTIVEQMPYLLTGGVVGTAFVIFGSAYLIVQNAREDRARLELKLDELVEAMSSGTRGAPDASAPTNLSGLVVAGTASYHVPGCRLVDGREEVRYLTPREATDEDLKPCRVCQPESSLETNVTVR